MGRGVMASVKSYVQMAKAAERSWASERTQGKCPKCWSLLFGMVWKIGRGSDRLWRCGSCGHTETRQRMDRHGLH